MMRGARVLTASAALAFAALGAAALDEPIRTVAALQTLSPDACREGRAFELEGEIVFAYAGDKAVFGDATGRIHLLAGPGVAFRSGVRARIAGTTASDSRRQQQCRVASCEERGSAAVRPLRETSLERILDGRENFELVSVTGVVAGVFHDDVDDDWNYLVLRQGARSLLVAVPDPRNGDGSLAACVRAVCRVSGIVLPNHANMRLYIGPHLLLDDTAAIVPLRPAAGSPFDAPALGDVRRLGPEAIENADRRRLVGRVAATWERGRRLLVVDDVGERHCVELLDGERTPACDSFAEVVGKPTTDLYRINLIRAQVRARPPSGQACDRAISVRQSDLFRDWRNRPAAPMAYDGCLLRLKGVVSGRDDRGRILLGEAGCQIPCDISSADGISRLICDGQTLEVVGVGIGETDTWRSGMEFPMVRGFFIVVRRAEDVTVLANPPWLTAGRFLTVVGVLFLLILAFAVWSWMLIRLVRRRGRELFRTEVERAAAELRAEDRMRLSVELHDSVSQSLTGVALQVDSALLAGSRDPSRADRHLRTARSILENCREELRNCLWDLRNRALDERDAAVAVRRTLAPHVGATSLAIDFAIPRCEFSDNTFHDVLRILRELVVNAVRHGRAAHVWVKATDGPDSFAFSVRDDGVGFDPAVRPGVAEGHFGLSGIEERLRHLGGRLEIASAPGEGTTAEFSIGRTVVEK